MHTHREYTWCGTYNLNLMWIMQYNAVEQLRYFMVRNTIAGESADIWLQF